jgi:hypothetical protein
MFRYGGPIKEGIMHGMKDGGSLSPQFNTGLVGDERYPKAGGREKHAIFLAPLAMQGLAAAGRFLAPRAIAAGAKAFGRGLATSPGKTGVFDKGLTIGQRLRNILPTGRFLQPATPKGMNLGFRGTRKPIGSTYETAPLRFREAIRSPEAIGRAVRENPIAAFALAGQIKNAPEIGKGIFDVGVGTGQAAINYLLGTEFGKGDKSKKAGEGEVKVVEQIGAGEGTTGGSVTDDPSKAKQIQEDRIAKTKKRYYELMGLDKMKKDAAYDSLIDASKIVQEEGADLKGAIRSGALQNKIIQAISKNLDKSADIKRQIDAAILKGEIEKDIRGADTTDKRLKEARIKQLDRAEKQASVTGQLAAVEIDKGFVPGGTTAAILRNEGIKYDKIIPDKKVTDFLEDNPTKTEADYIASLGIQLEDGRYVVGKRLVEKKGNEVAFIV